VRFLLFTGARRSRALQLRWRHVHGNRAVLPDTKAGGRTVPLAPSVVRLLKSLHCGEDNPWVITGRKPGSHLTDLQPPWRRIRAQAELPDVRIHGLRHSFASRALALGEGLPTIGKLLGHTQVQTTARYAHLARDTVRALEFQRMFGRYQWRNTFGAQRLWMSHGEHEIESMVADCHSGKAAIRRKPRVRRRPSKHLQV